MRSGNHLGQAWFRMGNRAKDGRWCKSRNYLSCDENGRTSWTEELFVATVLAQKLGNVLPIVGLGFLQEGHILRALFHINQFRVTRD